MNRFDLLTPQECMHVTQVAYVKCELTLVVVIPFGSAHQFSQDVWPEDGIAIIPWNQPRKEKLVCVTKKGCGLVISHVFLIFWTCFLS